MPNNSKEIQLVEFEKCPKSPQFTVIHTKRLSHFLEYSTMSWSLVCEKQYLSPFLCNTAAYSCAAVYNVYILYIHTWRSFSSFYIPGKRISSSCSSFYLYSFLFFHRFCSISAHERYLEREREREKEKEHLYTLF